jgi:hypothetical protein
MALRGAISSLRCALVPVVMAVPDHHDAVVMVPAAMPAIVAMLAEFGAGAVRAMMAVLDDHSLCTCQDYGDSALNSLDPLRRLHAMTREFSALSP